MIDWSRQRLLVLAPHPDDEVIGCGGLINIVKRAGGQVYVLYLTVGDTRDRSPAGSSAMWEREGEIDEVTKYFELDGVDIALPGNEYHSKLDRVPQQQLIDCIERDSALSIDAIEPTMVLFPEITSYNQDHRSAAQAVVTALRPRTPDASGTTPTALMYEEVGDSWALQPRAPLNFYVPLEPQDLDQKIHGLSLHRSQWRDHPHTRSAEALRGMAVLRGAQCGRPLAEAYHCARWVA